jgi:import inner membrane translocase subunit TIM22
MRYDTPLSAPITSTTPGIPAKAFTDLPIREQLRHGLKDMGRQTYSSAKNFGLIGAVFSGTECCIEGLRAKSDIYNGLVAGCLTGGALARNAGPQSVAVGCAGFAAFSAAIDLYMRKEEDERRFPVV